MNRKRWLLIGFALILLIALFPLRLAMAGLDDNAVLGVRKAEGSIWRGTLRDVTAGELVLGDFSARLSALKLLTGRAHFRLQSLADPQLRGVLFATVTSWGVRDVDAKLALAGAFAPLPVDSLELTSIGVRFSGDACAQASGQVRLTLRGSIAGVDLNHMMVGPLRCDGKSISALLVSPSAMERVALRIDPKGSYAARLNVRPPDAEAAAKLSLAGFRDTPLGHEFAFNGKF
jgi:general secretion pathway protein N